MIGRIRAVREIREQPRSIVLLVSTQAVFNIGFYMVMPYLAVHLAEDLGMAAWLVGLVLGLRTFSQQGMFAVGGLLTDRLGAKPVVLAGCLLRVLGFCLLGFADSVPSVLLGAIVTGFAAALFSPAVESSLSREAGEREAAGGPPRAEVFAQLAVAGEIGACLGPLVGAALLLVDFSAACLVAAAVFAAITAFHARWLPPREAQHRADPLFAGWREVLANRIFCWFAVGYSGYLVAYNQLYLALPREVVRATGDDTALGWLFALSAIMVTAGQLPLSALARRHLGAVTSVLAGFGCLAAAFAGVAASTLVVPLPGAWDLLPALWFVVLLTLGQMLAVPFANDLVARLAGERRLGSYYGVLQSVAGTAVLGGGALTGVLFDAGGSASPWLVLTALLVASSAVIGALARRNLLADAPRSPRFQWKSTLRFPLKSRTSGAATRNAGGGPPSSP